MDGSEEFRIERLTDPRGTLSRDPSQARASILIRAFQRYGNRNCIALRARESSTTEQENICLYWSPLPCWQSMLRTVSYQTWSQMISFCAQDTTTCTTSHAPSVYLLLLIHANFYTSRPYPPGAHSCAGLGRPAANERQLSCSLTPSLPASHPSGLLLVQLGSCR